MNTIKVVDCTLRDGGYYCGWHFPSDIVSNYLTAIKESGIDVVELGLRSTQDNNFYGPFAYCTDEFLDGLDLPPGIEWGVMINAKDYIGKEELIDLYFHEESNSRVSLVRIACHFFETDKIDSILNKLYDKGYKIGINLMQATGKNFDEYQTALRKVKPDKVKVLYFADSLGNMNLNEVEKIMSVLGDLWPNDLGVHAHDNMGKAVANTLAALDRGVSWLDGTIQGMGRGAGNARTEYLLLELVQKGYSKYRPEALYSIVLGQFNELKEKHKWGPNLMYYLSALYKIHPTFIQELLAAKDHPNLYTQINTINRLKNADATSFNSNILLNATINEYSQCKGNWNPEDAFCDRDVLLVGGGNSVLDHKDAIERYIEKNKLIVIVLNFNLRITKKLVDFIAASHPIRLLMERNWGQNRDIPIILPKSLLTTDVAFRIKDYDIRDFGLTVDEKKMESCKTSCVVPSPIAISYTLALVNSGKAKRVYMVGFDGYAKGDSRQDEMERILKIYYSNPSYAPLIALTKTTYNINQMTVYSPIHHKGISK